MRRAGLTDSIPARRTPSITLEMTRGGHWREESTPAGLVLEGWGQGLLVGSLCIMVCLTLAAMRRRVLLHKLILAEVGIPSHMLR